MVPDQPNASTDGDDLFSSADGIIAELGTAPFAEAELAEDVALVGAPDVDEVVAAEEGTAAASLQAEAPEQIAARLRKAAGLAADEGPSDRYLHAGVAAFAGALDKWYTHVMKHAVRDYRNLIISRINPFVRRIELDGCTPDQAAERIVGDYNSRNFVTAGGWALEGLAGKGSPRLRKSMVAGVDLEWYDDEENRYHVYVVKSGKVTRNSDILSALKSHGRRAEALVRQSGDVLVVNYIVAAGRTKETFADGVRRPTSGTFWSEVFALPEAKAVELALELSAEAGRRVNVDASAHVEALKVLVADYLTDRTDEGCIDWDFIARRNMRPRDNWSSDDNARHDRAWAVLLESGYEPVAPAKKAARKKTAAKKVGKKTATKKAAAKKAVPPSE